MQLLASSPSCSLHLQQKGAAAAPCRPSPCAPLLPPAPAVCEQPSTSAAAAAAAPCSRSVTRSRRAQRVVAAAAPSADAQGPLAGIPSTAEGTLISKTEVSALIQRDDFMDQIYRWALIEAGEGGIRNFGLPMDVEPFYNTAGPEPMIWGFKVAIFKEGTHLTDMAIMFDQGSVMKHEWVGMGDDGFPVPEGKASNVVGEFFEIWKLDKKPVDDTLRATIKAFCTGMVSAINRYYAFGSVFVDEGS